MRAYGRVGRWMAVSLFAVLIATASAAPTPAPDAPPATVEDEVRAAVERYFETWSTGNVTAYGRSFHPSAVVHHRDKRGRVRRMTLGPFLGSQRAAHAAVPGMVEVPVTIEIAHDTHAAQAKVHWRLVADGDVSCGEDHFQFVRIDEGWKITSLLFYGSPCRTP